MRLSRRAWRAAAGSGGDHGPGRSRGFREHDRRPGALRGTAGSGHGGVLQPHRLQYQRCHAAVRVRAGAAAGRPRGRDPAGSAAVRARERAVRAAHRAGSGAGGAAAAGALSHAVRACRRAPVGGGQVAPQGHQRADVHAHHAASSRTCSRRPAMVPWWWTASRTSRGSSAGTDRRRRRGRRRARPRRQMADHAAEHDDAAAAGAAGESRAARAPLQGLDGARPRRRRRQHPDRAAAGGAARRARGAAGLRDHATYQLEDESAGNPAAVRRILDGPGAGGAGARPRGCPRSAAAGRGACPARRTSRRSGSRPGTGRSTPSGCARRASTSIAPRSRRISS